MTKPIASRPRIRRKANPDAAVLAELRKLGTDLSKRRVIQFYLYFPAMENAERARSELIALGFSVECHKSATGSKWLCSAAKEMLPQFTNLNAMRLVFEQIAARLDGEYDGWETGVDAAELGGVSQ